MANEIPADVVERMKRALMAVFDEPSPAFGSADDIANHALTAALGDEYMIVPKEDRSAWVTLEQSLRDVEAERERCAKIAEGTAPIANGNFFAARRDQCAKIAAAIRNPKSVEASGLEGESTRHKPRPADCPGTITCGWHHVPTEPEIGLYVCSQPGCRYMIQAASSSSVE